MIKGKVIKLRDDGTAIIQAVLPLIQTVHRKVQEVYIDPIDSRPL